MVLVHVIMETEESHDLPSLKVGDPGTPVEEYEALRTRSTETRR